MEKGAWHRYTHRAVRERVDLLAGPLIGCGGLISTAQPLILPEDIGLIVELWTDELSSPTLLPPPRRELSKRGEGL